ncbi:hypothetical protein EP837_02130 [Sphingobium sp. EP60837]|nr:hypothetical protein EP837_02130 [Sphingobium sp. EP60837]
MVKKDLMRFLPALALLSICVMSPWIKPAEAQPTAIDSEPLAAGSYRWLEEGPFDGPLYLIISIERQMVHVYSGDRLVGMASVSTGTKGHRTPTGEYAILQKREWHRSNIYSNAPMPFMQRLTWDGIALHAGHNPGYPASHGCIRLPQAFARKLFALTQIGTLVRVNADDLRPALMLDMLVLNDPGTAVVTFTPNAQPPLLEKALVELATRDAPMLAIDPSVFQPRLRRW